MTTHWDRDRGPRRPELGTIEHHGRYIVRRYTVPSKHIQEGQGQKMLALGVDNDSTEDDEQVIEASMGHARDPHSPHSAIDRHSRHDRDQDVRDRDRDGDRYRDTDTYIRVSAYSPSPVRDRHIDRLVSASPTRHRPADDTRRPHGPKYRGHKSRHERRRSRSDALARDGPADQDTSPLLTLSSWLRRLLVLDDSGDRRGRRSSSHDRRRQHSRPRQSRWMDSGDGGDDHGDDMYHDDDHDDVDDYRPDARPSQSRHVSGRHRRERSAGRDDRHRAQHRARTSTLSDAAMHALKAGTMAAISNSTMPGDWLGEKGSRVATAALGAALVDTYMSHKHPTRINGIRHTAMRQVAERTIKSVTEPIFQRAAEHREHGRRGY